MRPMSAIEPAGRKTALAALSRAGVALLLIAMLAVALAFWLQVFGVKATQASNPDPTDRYQDYVVFYAAGRLVVDGKAENLYDVATISARETEALAILPTDRLTMASCPTSTHRSSRHCLRH